MDTRVSAHAPGLSTGVPHTERLRNPPDAGVQLRGTRTYRHFSFHVSRGRSYSKGNFKAWGTLSTLHMSLLDKMGVNVEKFGDARGKVEPLSDV